MTWEVHKFGGTSVADSERFRNVLDIVMNKIESGQVALVVSAMAGITDKLSELITSALRGENPIELLKTIETTHLTTADDLLKEEEKESFTELLLHDLREIELLVQSINITGLCDPRVKERILGYGELWSSSLLTMFLNSSGMRSTRVDTRDFLLVDSRQESVMVDWDSSNERLQKVLGGLDPTLQVIVFPGFIATDIEGFPTTLKRNGSDLSAAIIGALLKSPAIHIWTDVDGIYSADPRKVPDAVVLRQLSYLEALELAYFGAKILHPGTLQPAMSRGIPVHIHNTFQPETSGTVISGVITESDSKWIKGLAVIEDIGLLTLEGTGMIGVPGIARKLFTALSDAGISVIMISQASSEHSICVAVRREDVALGKKIIEKAFKLERMEKKVNNVITESGVSILSAVGDNMVNQPGIASILFNALARARINVRMISQGSSERNISVVISSDDVTKGLRAVHSAFYLSHLTISVGIIGVGLIGSSLIDQLYTQQEWLRENKNIDLKITALANSSKMILGHDIDLSTWKDHLGREGVNLDIGQLTDHVNHDSFPHAVIIDCTASEAISSMYSDWLSQGIHVITPNKKANSGEMDYYESLLNFIHRGPSVNPLERSTYYFYETTVGAGLPVISTLKDLLVTGDKIIEIEGILSGTLSYLFNEISGGRVLSEVLREAKELGYTEPDPRDDLSGLDFARKLIILARELGLRTELSDVDIEPLLPEELLSGTVDEFLQAVQKLDEHYSSLVTESRKNGEVLRYVGRISSDGKCSLRLGRYPVSHPFGNLRGSENIVLFRTSRYKVYPLVVRGPGAGAEVTSAGVFAELLRLASLLGNS